MEKRTINKADALDLCKTCKGLFKPGCDYFGVEGNPGEELVVPQCMEPLFTNSSARQNTKNIQDPDAKVASPHDKLASPHEDASTPERPRVAVSTLRPPTHEKVRPPQYSGLPFKWDELDSKIIALIKANYHRNAIISRAGKTGSTIQRRLARLIKHNIIMPTPQKIGMFPCITYVILQPWADSLIHNEGIALPDETPLVYDWHACGFRAEILDKKTINRPKGDRQFKMTNWTGETFYYPDHTIKLTTKHAIVDIKIKLQADSSGDLLIKYSALAQKFLGEFSARYNIPLGQVEQNREPHRRMPNSAGIAQALIEKGGELYLPSIGLQVDHSQDEEGELEFIGKSGARSAIILEEAINHFPSIVAGVRSDNYQTRQEVNQIKDSLSGTVKSLETTLTEIKADIKETQGLIILQEQNKALRAQNEELQKQVAELVAQTRILLGNAGAQPQQEPKPDKWSMIYG
ncbi:MAG: hypothetical protein O8C56_12165 [Candidatus Methanoperedens sp.]|nr:hypothetical protein [Candidatus Methanoperedens sp.]